MNTIARIMAALKTAPSSFGDYGVGFDGSGRKHWVKRLPRKCFSDHTPVAPEEEAAWDERFLLLWATYIKACCRCAAPIHDGIRDIDIDIDALIQEVKAGVFEPFQVPCKRNVLQGGFDPIVTGVVEVSLAGARFIPVFH